MTMLHATTDEKQAVARIKRTRARPWRLSFTRIPALQTIRKIAPDKTGNSTPLRLIADKWPEIVGPELAGICFPVKIVRRAGKSTLHISADSAAAPMLQHAGSALLDRMAVAGLAKPDRLRIIHTGHRKSAIDATKCTQAFNSKQQNALALSPVHVKNASLRSALTKLATTMSVDWQEK